MRAITLATVLLVGFALAHGDKRSFRGGRDYEMREYEHEGHKMADWGNGHRKYEGGNNFERRGRMHFPASGADLNLQPVIGILA
jgi:hypothetical protein